MVYPHGGYISSNEEMVIPNIGEIMDNDIEGQIDSTRPEPFVKFAREHGSVLFRRSHAGRLHVIVEGKDKVQVGHELSMVEVQKLKELLG